MCRAGYPDPAISGQPVASEKTPPVVVPQPATVATQTIEAVETSEAVAMVESAPPSWPDEAAESAMVSELRDRGETVVPAPAAESAEETDSRPLPPLNDLVQKIPTEVRDALEELFRARFVTVKRVPKKALKVKE